MQCGWQLSLWCELTPFRILETYSFKIHTHTHTHTYKIFVCIYMFLHFQNSLFWKYWLFTPFSTNSYKHAQTNPCVDGNGYSCLTRPLPFLFSLSSLSLSTRFEIIVSFLPAFKMNTYFDHGGQLRMFELLFECHWWSLRHSASFLADDSCWWILMIPSGLICIPGSPCPLNSQGWQLAKTKLPLLSNLLFPWDLGDIMNH